jgi:hypothetical protein
VVGGFDPSLLTTIKIRVKWAGGDLCILTVNKIAPCIYAFGSLPTYAYYLDFSVNPPVFRAGACTLAYDASGSSCSGAAVSDQLWRWTRNGCSPCGNTLATEILVKPSDN